MTLPDFPADPSDKPDRPDASGVPGTPVNGADREDPAGHPPGTPSPATDGAATDEVSSLPPELGGQKGPEPTRYGDWEKGGRCTDF